MWGCEETYARRQLGSLIGTTSKPLQDSTFWEENMGNAIIAFPNSASVAGATLPPIGVVNGLRSHLEEISNAPCFEGIVGNSPAIRKVLEQVAIVAPTDAPAPAKK